MHLEILTEDASTKSLLGIIVPKLCPEHTFRIISYKGIGRIPPNMKSTQDPAKRMLLEQLPRVIKGYDRTPGIDAIVVVLDADTRPCVAFLAELKALVSRLSVSIGVVFRLAIEETEAWLLGDRAAIQTAYPSAKINIIASYEQDSICGTWEKLADIIHKGGAEHVKKAGWPLPGQLKHEWASKIGPHMDLENNSSPSFGKLINYFSGISTKRL